jgi:hypothetical protein
MMTEIELIQAAQGASDLAMVAAQWQLTIITGYLLIAYFIGAKLSTLQVTFVNFVYLLMLANAVASVVMGVLRESYYTQQVLKISPETPNLGSFGDAAVACVVGSLIVTAGCLSYMWSVRHPKTA